jgi:LPXTG-motif cell wall-anchored protein
MSLDNTPPEENKPEGNPPEDNQYEEFRDQYEDEAPVDEETPVSNGNRTFLRFIGIIGSIIVLAVLVLAAYFVFSRSRLASRFQDQAAQLNAENTAVAVQATESSLQELQAMTQKAILPATWTPTPQAGAAQATATPKPANTTAPTSAGASDAEKRTATVAAFLTQSAQGGAIGTPVGTPVAQATTAPSATPRATATVRATSTTLATATTAGTIRATATLRVSATPLKTATALPQTGFADEVGLPGMLGLALALMIVVFAARRIRLSTSH